jgi:hypothetical protein
MYALIENNEIKKIYNNPRALNINDTQYPSNIFSLWSASEKEAIGIYEVVINNTNKKDEAYYINTNQSFAFADGVVTASFGTATGKLLEDRNEVDEAGEPLLDNNGDQVVTKGLKTLKKEIIKQQASGLLTPTDWYIIRKADAGTAVPSAITTHRAAVRTKSGEMETIIDNASDVDALAALYEYTEQEDGSRTRPLGEFPTLEV